MENILRSCDQIEVKSTMVNTHRMDKPLAVQIGDLLSQQSNTTRC